MRGLTSAVLLFALAACGSDVSASETTSEAPAPTPEPLAEVSIAPLPAETHRGVCVAHGYHAGGTRGYGSETSRNTLRELRALGATWVSLTPFGFMSSLEATEVRRITMGSAETDARMVAEIRAAKALGLRVLLKPHVWIRGGAFRGHVRPGGGTEGTPEGWDAFMQSHEAFILHYAQMAAAEGVEALVIGVEFDSAVSARPEAWRRLIARVRADYSGQLVYAANWDRADTVPFWADVDFVGVQFYPPLAQGPGAELGALRRAVGDRLDALVALGRRVGRPVLLTEVGYRAASDAAVRPHAWPERAQEARLDPAAQARAYQALMLETASRPTIRGLYLWKWFTDPDSTEEGPAGFSPRGRPAEEVIRAAFAPPGPTATP